VGPLCSALAEVGPQDGVTRLLLGNNIVGNGGARAIADLIRGGRSTITTWYIAGNRIDAEGLSHVCDALAEDTQVDMLWLKRNPIRPAGAVHLARMLSTNRLIHTLDLNNVGLLDEGAITILASLGDNGGTLRHLYMDGNGLGQAAAAAIGGHLAAGSQLESLVVSANRFGDEGAAAIAAGLEKDRHLRRLGLASNRIGPEGAAALAEALRAEGSLLAYLDLGYTKATAALGELGNGAGDAGAAAFAAALKTNTSLRSLELIHNGITQRGVDALLAILRTYNFSLVSLKLSSWGITRNDIAQNELDGLLRRNLNAVPADELPEVAEAHLPKHVRDIYSVYRVA